MPTSTESLPASAAATGNVDECDFCGRALHGTTAVERRGQEPEAFALCAECAFGVD